MSASKTSILIIDDDPSLRRVAEFTLSEAGYRVFTAADGEQGLRLFALEAPPVVITDIQLGGISGLEIVKRVKKESPETLVIVITAFGTIENAVEAMKIGAYDFISKPFSRDHLRLTLEKALAFQGLRSENSHLKEKLARYATPNVIGASNGMQGAMSIVRRVAPSEATVLIMGESGTGKELVARSVHEQSERRNGPFVPVNCAAIPKELLESELFGHFKGSFTGAVRDRKGKFELADSGTLFLDEIGELPLELQPKLLRTLQERVIEPVGGHPHKIDVRVVAATNRHLEEEMLQGSFREDLYYRLAVVPILVPPLRQRREDIPVLIAHFLRKHGRDDQVALDEAAMARMTAYDWPGNVRELENTIERVLILARSRIIAERDLPPRIRLNAQRPCQEVVILPETGYSLEAIEKEAILQALLRNDWNQSRAAAFLQVPRHILAYRIEKFGIRKK